MVLVSLVSCCCAVTQMVPQQSDAIGRVKGRKCVIFLLHYKRLELPILLWWRTKRNPSPKSWLSLVPEGWWGAGPIKHFYLKKIMLWKNKIKVTTGHGVCVILWHQHTNTTHTHLSMRRLQYWLEGVLLSLCKKIPRKNYVGVCVCECMYIFI